MSNKPPCDEFYLWAVREGPNGEIIGVCGKCDRDRSEHVDKKVKHKKDSSNDDCEEDCYSGESAGPGPGYESDSSIKYGYNSDVEPQYGYGTDSINSCEDENGSQDASDTENNASSEDGSEQGINFNTFELLFSSDENESYEWKCNTCSKMNIAHTWEEYMGNPACMHCSNVKNYWVCSNCSAENYEITACKTCHNYGL